MKINPYLKTCIISENILDFFRNSETFWDTMVPEHLKFWNWFPEGTNIGATLLNLSELGG